MRFRNSAIFLLLLLLIIFDGCMLGQASSGTLRIRVSDPSGAVVTQASVSATASGGQKTSAVAHGDGVYEIKALPPGSYKVRVAAEGFAAYKQKHVTIGAGQVRQVDVALAIEVQPEKIVIQEQGTSVEVNPANNAGAIVIREGDLQALSDDPDELQAELQALAGPTAGPNGGQLYIDGFTGGQLPPKSSIREVRTNQNSFSSEYDKLGYGRIEVITKPASDQFHGQLFVGGNSSALNSRNPFAVQEPDYASTNFSGSIGGPLSKKASFFFNLERRDITDASIVSAVVLDPSFNPVSFSQAVPNSGVRTNVNARLDYQFTTNNSLTVRYQFYRNTKTNQGIGDFSLASQGFNSTETDQTFQLSDTQIFGAKTVNQTRFQYVRERGDQLPVSTQPTVSVLGAFTGGGSSFGSIVDAVDRYEFQNSTSMSLGTHFLKFGGRLRAVRETNVSTSGFNGTFTFPSLTAYQITERGLQQGLAPAEIRAAGGGASQFSIIAGLPSAGVTLVDAGLFVGDDWRLRSNLTLSYGLRFETQNDISDHADLAPRLAIAWGVGRGKDMSPKTVLRAGFGMFYDRFREDLVLQAERLNGLTQEQSVVTSPDFFPNVPPLSALASAHTLPTVYRIDPRLRSPYTMQTAIAVERQLSSTATITITYLNSRGVHSLLSRNINAPLPGTYDPSDPASGIRPFGNVGNIYQYESEGIFKQNQLITNFNVRIGSKLSLFGYHVLNYANSDTAGASSFPTNQYDLRQDYGRAAFDIRQRLFIGGRVMLGHGFRVSPYLIASSGVPFNITVGQDMNGDSIFNDRPAFATDKTGPNVTATSLGVFDTAPIPGQAIIPPNFGTGPGRFTLNGQLSKVFAFGKRAERPDGNSSEERSGQGSSGKRGDQRYSLTLSMYARNLFNNVNLAPFIGNLDSPLFGQANALAGRPYSSSSSNRRIDLQAVFSF